MVMPLRIDINDKERLKEAMNAMKPGDHIEVLGNGGPMIIGVPSLDSNLESDDPPTSRQKGESWLD